MVGNSNPARGEVAVTLAGQAFNLVATAANVAALEAETAAAGLRDIIARLNAMHIGTIRLGLILLDAADREAAARKADKVALADYPAAGEAVTRALLFGLTSGNPIGAKGTKTN